MLARTESAISIRSLLEYNELKVEQKDAILLDAHNFLQEKDALTMAEKRDRFQELALRNEQSEKKFIHLGFTLDKVEEHFRLSQVQIQKAMEHISASVRYHAVNRPPYSLDLFRRDLGREKIALAIPALKERSSRLPREKTPIPDDGHGFFYVDCKNFAVVRDTALGQQCTAATVIRKLGIEGALREMYEQRQLQINRRSDEIALRPGHPDTAETRRAMLRLAPQHDKIIEHKLAEQQQQQQTMRQHHRHRH